MKEQLELLWQLQLLEREKKSLLAQKEKIKTDEVRRLWQEIRLSGQNLVADSEKLMWIQKVTTRQEADLNDANTQFQKLEEHLYNGEIKNVKEMEQVQAKYDALKREIATREEDVLRAMEECERLGLLIAREEEQLAANKRLHVAKQQETTQALGQAEEQLVGLDRRYEAAVAQIQQPVYNQYKALSRQVIYPVAKVENGICSGCRRGIPTRQSTLAATTQTYCDNCGRMLLLV